MKLWEAVVFFVFRLIVLVAAPLTLVYIVNSNYPGLLGHGVITTVYAVILLALPAVLLHFLADITQSSHKKMILELISLTLILLYTYIILGSGETHLYYKSLNVELYYSMLLYLILASIAMRYPTIFLRHYAEKSEEHENKVTSAPQ